MLSGGCFAVLLLRCLLFRYFGILRPAECIQNCEHDHDYEHKAIIYSFLS